VANISLFKAFPVGLLWPSIAYGTTESLDIGILLWLAGLDVFQPDLILFYPTLNHAANALQAIVASYESGFSPFDDLVERHDPFRRQRVVDLDLLSVNLDFFMWSPRKFHF
jgi:hypothetical protein